HRGFHAALDTPAPSEREQFHRCRGAGTFAGCDDMRATSKCLSDVAEGWLRLTGCASIPHLKDDYWMAVNFALIQEATRLGVRLDVFEHAFGRANTYQNRRGDPRRLLCPGSERRKREARLTSNPTTACGGAGRKKPPRCVSRTTPKVQTCCIRRPA